MNLLDAIKTCYKNYATFKGRASRSEFWYFWLFNYAIYAILIIIAWNISLKFFWFLGLFFLVNFIPYIAVTARRLHDVNKSGWFQILPLPFSILDRILERTSQDGLSTISGLITTGLYIYLIVLWCTKGGEKNNRFGKNIYKKIKKRG
tara:strand:- start:380 stop:823 length:444 start_codon:yes stop_codon:yes gene_type:complete